MTPPSDLDIAVVGGGVAGIVAAYLLDRRHRVSLYEKNDSVGGHTHTRVVNDGEGKQTPVDTGFIVFNDRTYSNFIRFIDQLGVDRLKSPMSFSYSDRRTGFTYASSAPFADPKNRLRPSFWHFLFEIMRFNRLTRRLLKSGALAGLSLEQYLKQYRFSDRFAERYILPMGAAIWSTADRDMQQFPAETFARFFENHGLLTLRDHPQWYTIAGGSHEYVKAFLNGFGGRVFTGEPVRSVARQNGRVRIQTDGGAAEYDRVIIASHADEALAMLENPSNLEADLLSAWRYTDNRVLLHRDAACLPPFEKARASWNYLREADAADQPMLTMTYYMNRLQQLNTADDFCVTLNPQRPIAPEKVIADIAYAHPLFNEAAVASQAKLDHLNDQDDIFYCGSYFRYGFHEDAVLSAVNVGKRFGIDL